MLTEEQIAAARLPPGGGQLKLHDGNGLYFRLRTGGAGWVLRFRKPGGGETMLSLGSYPQVSLDAARIAANRERALLEHGHDPAQLRQQKRAAARSAKPRKVPKASGTTLGELANRWIVHQRRSGHLAEATLRTAEGRISLLKPLAGVPVADLTAARFAKLWAAIVADGDRREYCKRAAGVAQQILRHGAALGIAGASAAVVECNVSAASIPSPHVTHRPAVTETAQLRTLMAAIGEYKGRTVAGAAMVRDALRFSAYTAARPIEVRGMVWGEVHGDTWIIPPARYKTGKAHAVPLSQQARLVIDELRVFRLDEPKPDSLVFAWRDGEGLSENALNSALAEICKGAGLPAHRSHGWRAAFKTTCSLQLNADRDLVELCLGHQLAGSVEAAYLRDEHDRWRIQERAALLQRWADWLDGAKAS